MKLVITDRARKDLAKLDDKTRQRILAALDNMVFSGSTSALKKLQGTPDRFRLRVGDYRVLLRMIQEEAYIYALRVKHRREAYR
ncbi:MAG TPA: type II toxin-antitoxin system RelE/ParE family toxin [Spirochaetia bacterium]|nr:type II toxin-antitoxin system RelE/ParE family toxin [Spirochaetia bacterium]